MTPIQKTTFSLVIFAVLVAGFCIFVIYPQINSIQTKSQELIFQKSRLANLELKIENLRSFQNLREKEKSQFEKIEKLFFDPEVPIEFIEFLEKEAENSKLQIKISAGASKKLKADIWPSTNFQLTLAGYFSDFLKFLEKLELGPWLLEVSSLNIKKITEEGARFEETEALEEGAVTCNLSLKVFSK